MAQHRSSRSPVGVSTNARHAKEEPVGGPDPSEITDIIPFNEFGDLAELDFRENSAFDRESQVIQAPELDDLHDTDDLTPLRLAVPSVPKPMLLAPQYAPWFQVPSFQISITSLGGLAGSR